MRAVLTIVVEHDDDPCLADYESHADFLVDVYQGRVEGHIVSAVATTDDGIDPYDGDPCNEVADLATNFDITKVYESSTLKEDFVYAEIDFDGGGFVSVRGSISWVLPILRAAHGGAGIG